MLEKLKKCSMSISQMRIGAEKHAIRQHRLLLIFPVMIRFFTVFSRVTGKMVRYNLFFFMRFLL